MTAALVRRFPLPSMEASNMPVKVKERSLETLVERLTAADELGYALAQLNSHHASVDRALGKVQQAIENATNDRGRLLKSKLDRPAITAAIVEMRSAIEEALIAEEEVQGWLHALEAETGELAEAFGETYPPQTPPPRFVLGAVA